MNTKVMRNYNYVTAGTTEIIQVTGTSTGAGTTTASLQPAAHVVYIVHGAIAYHNDVAARVIQWQLHTPTADLVFYDSTTGVAASTPYPLMFGGAAIYMPLPTPIAINYYNYINMVVTALGNTKVVTVNAVVTKITGTR